MQNDNSRMEQTQGKNRGNESLKSAVKQGEEKIKDLGGEAQKQIQAGQEQVGQAIGTIDQQVRDNPWPIIAGVAIGAFLLGSLISKSNK